MGASVRARVRPRARDIKRKRERELGSDEIAMPSRRTVLEPAEVVRNLRSRCFVSAVKFTFWDAHTVERQGVFAFVPQGESTGLFW